MEWQSQVVLADRRILYSERSLTALHAELRGGAENGLFLSLQDGEGDPVMVNPRFLVSMHPYRPQLQANYPPPPGENGRALSSS